MPLPLLIVTTLLMPFVWGWAMYWLITRVWPASERTVPPENPSNPIPSPYDYQI